MSFHGARFPLSGPWTMGHEPWFSGRVASDPRRTRSGPHLHPATPHAASSFLATLGPLRVISGRSNNISRPPVATGDIARSLLSPQRSMRELREGA